MRRHGSGAAQRLWKGGKIELSLLIWLLPHQGETGASDGRCFLINLHKLMREFQLKQVSFHELSCKNLQVSTFKTWKVRSKLQIKAAFKPESFQKPRSNERRAAEISKSEKIENLKQEVGSRQEVEGLCRLWDGGVTVPAGHGRPQIATGRHARRGSRWRALPPRLLVPGPAWA